MMSNDAYRLNALEVYGRLGIAGVAITRLFSHSGGTSGNLSAMGKLKEGRLFLSVLDRALSLI